MRIFTLFLVSTSLLSTPVIAAELATENKETPPPISEAVRQALTLDVAIQKALAQSPQLKAFASAKMANKGGLRQAGALPNPELAVEVENFAGDGPYKGLDSAEATYGISQLIEIGGKRSARTDMAEQNYQIAGLQYQAARLNVIRDVTVAYAEAVAAHEAMALAQKQQSLAKEVLENVTERVNAAAEPLFQKSKSEVAYSTSQIAYDKAQRDYIIARKQLAALWGEDAQSFELDSSNFYNIAPPEPLTDSVLRANPDYTKLEAELARSKASYDLERANAIPDPSITGGIRDFRDTNERAFVAGVSIPIPVFNMNRGNIAKARHEVSQTESEKRNAEIELGTELTRNQQALENAYRQAQSLKDTVIPAAEKAYSLSRSGYRSGKFPYLEVLDAQRTLVEARAEYNDTLKEYHTKRAEVERLTAKNLPANNQKEEADAE